MQEAPLVLIAVDGSKEADYAFHYYFKNMHNRQSRVFLFHCVSPPVVHIADSPTHAKCHTELQSSIRETVGKLEAKYRELLTGYDVNGSFLAVMHRRHGEAILKTARKEGAGLIVMGTRGLGKVSQVFSRSQSNYVVRNATCTVSMLKAPSGNDAVPSAKNGGEYVSSSEPQRTLIQRTRSAVDFSDSIKDGRDTDVEKWEGKMDYFLKRRESTDYMEWH